MELGKVGRRPTAPKASDTIKAPNNQGSGTPASQATPPPVSAKA